MNTNNIIELLLAAAAALLFPRKEADGEVKEKENDD